MFKKQRPQRVGAASRPKTSTFNWHAYFLPSSSDLELLQRVDLYALDTWIRNQSYLNPFDPEVAIHGAGLIVVISTVLNTGDAIVVAKASGFPVEFVRVVVRCTEMPTTGLARLCGESRSLPVRPLTTYRS